MDKVRDILDHVLPIIREHGIPVQPGSAPPDETEVVASRVWRGGGLMLTLIEFSNGCSHVMAYITDPPRVYKAMSVVLGDNGTTIMPDGFTHGAWEARALALKPAPSLPLSPH
jgi:hypothetical protein